jgi:hypothetical protein
MRSDRARIGRRIATTVVLVVGAVVTTSAGTAGAAASPAARLPHRQIAGYVAPGTGDDSAGFLFHIPALTCSEGAPDSSVDVGSVVYFDDGTFTDSAIEMGCSGGAPWYASHITIKGVETRYTSDVIVPGDQISLGVIVFSGNTSTGITDITQQWGHNINTAGAMGNQYASGVIARGCTNAGCVPVPQFPTLRFKGNFGGGPIPDSAQASRIKAADGSVEAKAKPGANGTNKFAVKWVSTCAPVDSNGLC